MDAPDEFDVAGCIVGSGVRFTMYPDPNWSSPDEPCRLLEPDEARQLARALVNAAEFTDRHRRVTANAPPSEGGGRLG